MVTLFLMTRKGLATLEHIGERYASLITAVVSARDPNVIEDYYEDIQAWCEARNIPFYDRKQTPLPTSTYALAISWRWLIPVTAFEKLIIFHDSLLPKYRGFNPLVTALINGDREIGVTALYAAEEYDRGPIIAQYRTTVTYPIKIQEAIEQISVGYGKLAAEILEQIKRGETPQASPQDDTQASYSLWRDELDYRIDWHWSASKIKRFVDAVGFPYKGAASQIGERLVRILEVSVEPDVVIANRTPGKVIFLRQGKPTVVCGQGLVRIEQMIYDDTQSSALPLKRFRVRFT